ncbi:MAG TPA: TatD family hydrolase [Dehalococcoidia bacterium]|nr:TatD family hydrolase [Dehalococcoidia bacterium]
MPWFDTHVHLDRYAAAERAALLRRARAAGVVRLLAVAVDCASARRVVALPAGVFKAVGVHPRHAAEGICPELEELAARPGVVAIGEAGFDGAGPDFAVQEAVFRAQCALARRLNLALMLHIDGAGAWPAFAAAGALAGLRVVRHYFTGDAAQAAWHGERGHWLSFGRPLLREPALQAIARAVPAARLLIETDSYPLPGRRTEPRDLAPLGLALARLRGWSEEQCAEQLWQNAVRAFQLPSQRSLQPASGCAAANGQG